MSLPPPFVYGSPRFWTTLSLADGSKKQFPVSLELYIAIREVLNSWTTTFCLISKSKNNPAMSLNLQGQSVKEVMMLTVPRLFNIFVAVNNGMHPPDKNYELMGLKRLVKNRRHGTLHGVSIGHQRTSRLSSGESYRRSLLLLLPRNTEY